MNFIITLILLVGIAMALEFTAVFASKLANKTHVFTMIINQYMKIWYVWIQGWENYMNKTKNWKNNLTNK